MALEIIKDAICTCCGCMCNDIELRIEDGRAVEVLSDCPEATSWFQRETRAEVGVCEINNQPATFESGITKAAEILRKARYPLVFGLRDGTTESQRLAIEIAELLCGVIDTSNSARRGPSGMTFRGVGEVTCTLGEVRHRSDLVVYWRCNPALTHPRHFELYSLYPLGEFVPNGRGDRTCFVIDEEGSHFAMATAEHSNETLVLRPESELEAIWILRALAADVALDAEQVLEATGVELSVWQDLVARIKNAKHTAIFFDESRRDAPCEFVAIEALHALVKDLNRHTRVVSRSLGSERNGTGAEQVLTWSTGYPHSVDFSRGYPRFSPTEYSAGECLARGEIDAVLLLGNGEQLPADDGEIPRIAINQYDADGFNADVRFRTSLLGLDHGGTVYRVDGVPLPLRPFRKSHLPNEAEVLAKLLDALRSSPKPTACGQS